MVSDEPDVTVQRSSVEAAATAGRALSNPGKRRCLFGGGGGDGGVVVVVIMAMVVVPS
jgi:hypothetical protein